MVTLELKSLNEKKKMAEYIVALALGLSLDITNNVYRLHLVSVYTKAKGNLDSMSCELMCV